MSHVAVAIDNVSDGDILEAAGVNEVIDATNANTDAIQEAEDFIGAVVLGDFDIENPPVTACVPSYAVGDTGPAGGLVFFVSADGCNGLEAWLVDEAENEWGCNLERVGANGRNIGSGAPNSLIIENATCIDAANTVPVIRNDVKNGESDWYLPSKNELERMYQTIGPGAGPIDFVIPTGRYWSSSEIDAGDVWIVDFDSGESTQREKHFSSLSRAVRTFNEDDR
jgi:hypothetical protein